jgi:hypothetical protein
MSAHLSRLRLFQRHLRSLVWVWVWVWDWIHSHTPPRTRSPSSRHPPFTHYPFPLRSLVCGGQTSPHKPRLVVSHSTCPPLSSSPHANSFVLGTAVINTHENLERTGRDSGSKSKFGRRSILRWIPHQAKTSVGATRVSVSNRRTPMRVQFRPRANDRWIPHRSRRSAWARAGLRGEG